MAALVALRLREQLAARLRQEQVRPVWALVTVRVRLRVVLLVRSLAGLRPART